MNEEFEDLGNDDINELIERFEDCQSTGQGCFFDSDELLEVIDYFFAVNEVSKTKSAIELALQLYPNEIEINIRKAQFISQEKRPSNSYPILRET